MRYMLLIHSQESDFATMSDADNRALMEEYGKFSAAIEEAGVLRGSDRLRPTPMATTVRVRNGDTMTTDGPFAETKEQLGGYYLIEVDDLDAAIGWAARIPSARMGSIEVRPIWEPEDYMES